MLKTILNLYQPVFKKKLSFFAIFYPSAGGISWAQTHDLPCIETMSIGRWLTLQHLYVILISFNNRVCTNDLDQFKIFAPAKHFQP
jgi:hypothetical protein